MVKGLVTVIIPLYNVEAYVDRCIKSVLNQDYEKIEVIIVDDGSTDGSLRIAHRASGGDKRVKIIHKENGGVSSARNLGLEKARGEYVVFVDSDDYLDRNCVSFFRDIALESHADIVLNYAWHSDFNNDNPAKGGDIKEIPPILAAEQIYTGKIDVAVWNKMYSLRFLKKNMIEFDQSIWYGEGMLFNMRCLSSANKVVATSGMVYHQTYNPNSVMRNFSLKNNLCGIESMYKQKKVLSPIMNERLEKAWDFHLAAYNMSILKGIIKTGTREKYRKQYNKCKQALRRNGPAVLTAPVSCKKKMIFLLAMVAPVAVAKILIFKEDSVTKTP